MSTELREAIVIGVECFVFSFLLFLIFIFGGYAKDALNIKHTQDLAMTDITDYRNIYQFTEGKEVSKSDIKTLIGEFPYNSLTSSKVEEVGKLGKILKGDDIVRFVGLYPQEYNILIKNGTKRLTLEQSGLFEDWSISNVSDWLGPDIIHDYYCIVVYDELNYQYDSIIFIKK